VSAAHELDCASAAALYADALEGRLEKSMTQNVLHHMRACPSCSREVPFLSALAQASAEIRIHGRATSTSAPGEGRAQAVTWSLGLAAVAFWALCMFQALTPARRVLVPAAQPAPVRLELSDAVPVEALPPDCIVEVSVGKVFWRPAPGQRLPQPGQLRWVLRAGASMPGSDELYSSAFVATVRVTTASPERVEAVIAQTSHDDTGIQRGNRVVIFGHEE